MKHLLEKRSIRSAQDALEILNNGKLAGRIGGKKYIPAWILEDPEHFANLVDATLTLLGDDPNIAGDETIIFLIKCTLNGPEKWEEAISKSPDTLIALSQAFGTQWFKDDSWAESIENILESDSFNYEDWHKLEHDIIEFLSARRAKKGRKVSGFSENFLYDTLYDDGTWKLFSPKTQEGDSVLASGIEPFIYEGTEHYKTRWCTAAGKGYWDSYTTPHHSRMYVIQYWVDGKYVEAWQLVYSSDHIDFMDKFDKDHYGFMLTGAPRDLLEKVVDDNPNHIYLGVSLQDIIDELGPVNTGIDAIYREPHRNAFFRKQLRHVDDYIMTSGGIVIKIPADEELVIPEGATALNLNIAKHDPSMFANVRKITFPSTFKYIYANTFREFPNLEEVVFGNIARIGKGAFSYCKNLNKVIFPKEVEELTLGTNCFYYCNSLEDIKLPLGLKKIGRAAFSNSKVTQIYIPGTCTDFTFEGSKSITHIAIGKGLESIPKSAFYRCERLEWVKLPESIKTIEESAFDGCTALKQIELPEGLLAIGFNAFARSGLSEIKFPESLLELGSMAFRDCRYLHHVTLSHGIKKFKGDAFRFDPNLTKVDNIEILPKSAWGKVFPEAYRSF